MYGQDVTYPVIIDNQGNVTSDATEVTIAIPDGFIFDPAANPDWVDNGDGTITYASTDPILPGESDMVDLILEVQPTDDPDGWDLDAEITLAQDENGDDLEDIDSTPGDNSSPFDVDANDLVDADTIGDSEIDGGDDQDPGFIEVFDLALTKVTMMTTGNSFGDTIEFMITVYNQGNVPATNVEVTDFMPDGFGYVAANDAAGWVFDPALMTATTTITDVIAPGESTSLSYFVTIMMSNMGDAFQNQAEISAAEDENGNSTVDGTLVDADSTPDAINGNDAGGEPGTDSDNEVDGDGTGVPGDGVADTDEDDSDPALIQVIDVALTKTIVDGQAPFAYGTPVDFEIVVENQGNEPLFDVEVTDYIPAGYEYVESPGWTFDSATSTATTVIKGPMEMWDMETLTITLTPIQLITSTDSDAWTNVAEVSEMFSQDENGDLIDVSALDIDSQSDDILGNDPGGAPGTDSDDSTNGNGNDGGGAPGDTDADSDEDDADPALLPVFDLALTKGLANPDSVYVFGDEMEFVIQVTNQGNQPVTDVEITEYIPGSLTDAGVVGDNTGWTFGGEAATYTVMDIILPGESVEVTLFMVFQPTAGGIEEYVNVAEISEFADTLGNNSTDNADIVYDIDSTPDAIEGNDAGGEPDFPGAPSGTDNTIDNENGDEDDSDPVLLGFVDMALAKTLVDPNTPVRIGDDVTFAIEVTNQGTIPMVDVEVIDYIPAGFELSADDTNDWEIDADGNATNTVDGPLGFGESETIEIVLTVLPTAQADNMINVAELTSFFFESGVEATDLDIDSEANDTNGDDAGGDVYGDSNDAVDGDGTGMPGDNDPLTDEDDSDPAVPNVLDLALTKTIDPATPAVRPGDVVTFTIEVCNQGNIPVSSVVVEDRIPAGMILSSTDANGWTVVDATKVSNTVGMLERDGCATLEIDMEVLANSSAADMINVAEITQVLDTAGVDVTAFDIDSTPDNDAGEAEGVLGTDGDDSTDGSFVDGEDEDDADPAAPPVMDLAIQKINPVVGPSTRGDIVPFEITVYNQGNMVTRDIEITDYIPAGLEATADNTGWTVTGATATFTVAELLPGEDTTIVINLEILQTATPMNVVNMSEVSSATDTLGVVYSEGGNDYDSNFDADNGNDVGNEIYDMENNDVIDENGIGHGADGIDDEDDHDQAWVLLCDGMACKGSINLSIDSTTCSAEITAEMLMTGDLFPNSVYEIILKDENNNEISNPITSKYINQTIIAEVYNPLCGNNTCWLPILVEYKYKPQIVCTENDTLSCTQAFDESIVRPDVSMNCAEVTLDIVDEQVENFNCDPLFTSKLTRKYVAVDEFGNTSDTCEQVIFLERTNLDNISPVQAFSIYNDNAISCSSGFATTSQGYPYPALSVTGAPRLEVEGGEFVDLYPFESNVICNGFAEFKDEILPGSTSCVTKILRTFTIGEWWCGGTNEREFIQLIEVVDFTGPEIACPIDMTVSTGSFECIASVSVPLPVASDACNDDLVYNLGTPVGDFENYNGESFELGVGVHTLQYAVYDACEQGSFCSFTVTVVDNADPIAICDQFTSVSLSLETTTYVTAESIDDGSFDECGPVTLSVARMDDPGFADFSGFGPRVDIDCADAGQSIMVGLLVTDAGGNTNMCMVSVDVVDKVEAQMVCPADMTVECNFAYDPLNLSAFFGEVEIFDNCPSANTIEEEIVGELNTCGSGVLTRQIRLLNAQGEETDNCAQTITFVSGDPLSLSDITPPTSPVEIDGCGIDALGMINITGPIIPAGICQQAATSVTSDTFPFTEEGACLKIIRTYKVIDWCISDGPGSVTEPFVFEQIIKVSNSEKPVFTEVFEDSTYCSFALDCGGRQIDGLTASASDDCTVDSELIKRYETRDASGAVVRFGLGHDASGVYDLGDYTVRFIAEDRCGNQEIAESTFTIMSCKQPVPYCLDGISTTLTAMDTDNDGTADSEQVMLTPSFFDAGSYHPCGLDVTLSFSSDINDTTAVFSCADTVGIVEVELWVTVIDGEGNPMFDMADFCIASLDVQDNESIELCNDGLKPVDIQGRIYTASDAELHEASVRLISAEMQLDMTDENGEYGFMDMPQGGSYSIAPLKDDDVLNGVSTLDLVMIQRHILGIADFENVYQYIAGDINHDERLTAADLSSLRKVILGVSNTYANNTSWRFIDEAHEFEDSTDPWTHDFAETYDITTLSEDMWVDFIAVKVGDINGNVEANVQAGIISETRSNESLILSLPDTEVEKDELYEIEVQTRASLDVRGLQVGFRLDGLELVDIKQGAMDIRPSDIFTDGSTVKMSYANAIGDQVSSEEVLYTMVVRATSDGRLSEKLSIEDNTLASEAYMGDDLEVGSVALEWRSMENVDPVALLLAGSVTPNPWRSQTEIHFELPRAGEVNLTVRDASGRVIHQMSGRFLAGEQSFSISKEDVNATGVLLYELQYGDQIENRKMIRIE